MNNGELEINMQSSIDAGCWQFFGISINSALPQRPITKLPNGRYVELQGRVYWLGEFVEADGDDEIDPVLGVRDVDYCSG